MFYTWLKTTTPFPHDAGQFWTALQALIVLGALILTYKQLKAFVDSERLKTALAFAHEYLVKGSNGRCMADVVRQLRAAVEDLPHYKSLVGRYSSLCVGSRDYVDVNGFLDCIVDVYNYYDRSWSLYTRRALDQAFYIDVLHELIIDTADDIVAAIEVATPQLVAIDPELIRAWKHEALRYKQEVKNVDQRHSKSDVTHEQNGIMQWLQRAIKDPVALGTLLLAAATVYLAFETRGVLNQTVLENRTSDARLRPQVVATVDGADTLKAEIEVRNAGVLPASDMRLFCFVGFDQKKITVNGMESSAYAIVPTPIVVNGLSAYQPLLSCARSSANSLKSVPHIVYIYLVYNTEFENNVSEQWYYAFNPSVGWVHASPNGDAWKVLSNEARAAVNSVR